MSEHSQNMKSVQPTKITKHLLSWLTRVTVVSLPVTALASGQSSPFRQKIDLEIQSQNCPHFLIASKPRTKPARVVDSAWFPQEFPGLSTENPTFQEILQSQASWDGW